MIFKKRLFNPNDYRIRKKFLFYPKSIIMNDEKITKIFEKVLFVERYDVNEYWDSILWIDNEYYDLIPNKKMIKWVELDINKIDENGYYLIRKDDDIKTISIESLKKLQNSKYIKICNLLE